MSSPPAPKLARLGGPRSRDERSPGARRPAPGAIARQEPAAAAEEGVFAAAAAPPVLLSAATVEKVRTILAAGTSPATARTHAGDVSYFWAWAAAELGLAERCPASPAAVVQFVADHLEGLPEATETALCERAAQGLPGGKPRPGPHALATIRRRLG